jgi:hypothetical protein
VHVNLACLIGNLDSCLESSKIDGSESRQNGFSVFDARAMLREWKSPNGMDGCSPQRTPSAERRCWTTAINTNHHQALHRPILLCIPFDVNCSIKDAGKHRLLSDDRIWYLGPFARKHRTTIEPYNPGLSKKKAWRDQIAIEYSVRRYTLDNDRKPRLEAE